ncbi:90626764-a0bf-41ce-8d4a-9b3371f44018 [Sclerotinia trifoliorum]|uniref:90626764-a0bf-41ce-8d4a-9b3371f44018 n=1 Tax=Sclerotinia trifoliorum TaxID=28548 RepID=A0A8H2VQK8_9HELO|nr:90626764-a0bf-41ce-8d4a-9b3371f44018 [Sclerotinia trifoliorum]
MDSLPSQTSSLNPVPGVQRYSLGSWKLQSGQEIPDAHIAYKTFGDPSSPAIVYPSWFSGAIADNEWLIGETQALNPQKYFIIITALFGNGESTSPSNSPSPLPQNNLLRQRPRTTQTPNRPSPNNPRARRNRLVYGRSPNVPMGYYVSIVYGYMYTVLWICKNGFA